MHFINKEDLERLYIIENKTTKQIGEIYNVDRTTISNKLKKLGIEINKKQRQYQELNNKQLTKQQISLIIGSLLGDGSLIKNGRRITPYFKVSHCEKQKEYLEYKHDVLKPISTNIFKNIDKRGNSVMYGFNTLSNCYLIELRDLFYTNNTKVIKEELINYIDELSLAIWYFDDGSIGKTNCRLSTESFTFEENNILKNILIRKFNIEPKVCKYKNYCYLHFNKTNSEKLINIVKEYCPQCLKYKLKQR